MGAMQLYLVTMTDLDESSGQFSTVIAEPRRAPPTAATATRVANVARVEKAPGNPYPDRISVGRARNCDVVMREPSVSKLHAHFRKTEHGLIIEDLGSQNGTRVNGVGIGAHQPEPVAPGDSIQLGSVFCRLVDADGLKALGASDKR